MGDASAWLAFCSTSTTVVPWRVDLLDDREDLLDEDGREAQRRLVEEQEARAGHQRPADGQHLLLAARQRAALLRHRSLSRGNSVEHPLDARRRCRLRSRVKAPIWRFSRTVSREKIRRPSGACPMPSSTSSWAAVCEMSSPSKKTAALARVEQARDRLQRRRLARAVGADERDDLARDRPPS